MFKISFSQNNAFKLTLDSDENHEDSRSYLPYEDISLLEGKLRIEFTRTANLEGEINYFQFRSEEGLLEEWENKLRIFPKFYLYRILNLNPYPTPESS